MQTLSNMKGFLSFILAAVLLVSVAAIEPTPRAPLPSTSTGIQAYTGFSYGAFWPADEKPKTYADFLRHFKQAKDLPNVPVSFNSARLFQTGQWQNPTLPSEAFQAAIETNTTLLLGLWISTMPNELIALDAAFKVHGQKLADLVVGISVGNEDIFRSSPECTKQNNGKPCDMQYTPAQVLDNVALVRDAMKKWNHLFSSPPPIGHTDAAQNAAQGLEPLDFMGTNVYPFWSNDPISKAGEIVKNILADVEKNASSKPVWITETGWPSSGQQGGTPAGSVENMRKYWVDVGCKYFGKRNIWWFQLEKDTKDAFDWGILDANTHQPKFDLSCPVMAPSNPVPPTSGDSTNSEDSSNSSDIAVFPRAANKTACEAVTVTITVTSQTVVASPTSPPQVPPPKRLRRRNRGT